MKLKFDFLKESLILLVCLLAFSNFGLAQRTISGTVTDKENNEALIGATVVAIGSTTGTITDFDGKYSLDVPEGTTALEISYTGYPSMKVEIGVSNTVDVSLAAGTVLDEIVVVGYGAVKKSDATGAVTSVSEKDFNKGVISSPEQLIQGRAAGVQITTSSGEPGAGINIRIRGTSSVRSGNNPLFVIDGVPLTSDQSSSGVEVDSPGSGLGASSSKNPLNFLNPNDIASIDILKDASATAIYGSRGANGVVIITTKSGSANQGGLTYGYSVGFSKISKRYDLLNASEFLEAYASFNGQDAANGLNGGAQTDWQDELFRTAVTHDHNLSFGDGDQNGHYRFSVSYQDQEGIVKESGLERVSARFNGSKKFINNRLKIGTQLTIANTHDDNVLITDNSGFEGDLMGNILKANPTNPVFNEDGTYFQPGETEPNPVALNDLSESYTNTLRALGNISFELTIIDELTFTSRLGIDRSFSSRIDAFSRDLAAPGVIGKGRLFTADVDLASKLWENFITYKKGFGKVKFTGLLGYSYQEFRARGKSTELVGFRTSDLDVMINNQASADQGTGSGIVGTNSNRTIDELQSFYGRVNVDISEKYLFTATLRADGSTRFGEDNRYGYFPSAAFKWRIVQEGFIPDAFDDLGLRLGFGITGNQEIPHNVFQGRQRYNNWDINGGGDVGGGGLASVAFANPNLKWESTRQFNVGLDFAFLNYRLSGSLDFYNKNTNDLLIQVNSAQPAVSPFVWENLDADVVNTGLELALNYVLIDNSDFKWDFSGNIAYNKNEVKNFAGLINTGDIDGQGLTGAFAQRIAEGQPLFAFFLREFGGFDDEGITIYPNGDFQQFVGASPLPTWNTGFTNNFNYKGFNLSFFFSGQFGHSVYSNTENAFFTAGSLANGRNVIKDVVGNGEGNLNAPDVSTRFLESASFLRLQNLTLGYSVNTSGIEHISSLRFFVTGQNLFVITGYSGQDPEVNVNKAIDGVPSLGIDYTTYPRATTWSFGFNVGF